MGGATGEQNDSLKGKWWYRLLRVILISVYVTTLALTLDLIYNSYQPRTFTDTKNSVIVCDDGKTYPLIGSEYYLGDEPQLSEDHANTARSLCSFGAPFRIDPNTGERVQVLTPQQFARRVKGKYPEYQHLADEELTRRVLAKYPEYRSVVALHSYTVKLKFGTEGSWAEVIWHMAIGWLGAHLAIVVIRGAVLYVAVGRFLPTPGPRGWLVL
jgi:hypothetical protein